MHRVADWIDLRIGVIKQFGFEQLLWTGLTKKFSTQKF